MDTNMIHVDVGGATLECEVLRVPGVDSTLAAIIFHPWAWLGGCMWDPVVTALTRQAAASGLFKIVVRYNVRGAGSSSGFKSFSAASDAEDAAGLCRYVLERMEHECSGVLSSEPSATAASLPAVDQQQPARKGGAAGKLVLLAYSYGSCVAASLLEKCGPGVVSAYVSVGFPLGMLSRMFLGSHSSWQALMHHGATAGIPCLLLMGTQDQFTDLSTIQGMVQKHHTSSKKSRPPENSGQQEHTEDKQQQQLHVGVDAIASPGANLHLEVVQGCDHFFYGQCDQVARVAVSWVKQHV